MKTGFFTTILFSATVAAHSQVTLINAGSVKHVGFQLSELTSTISKNDWDSGETALISYPKNAAGQDLYQTSTEKWTTLFGDYNSFSKEIAMGTINLNTVNSQAPNLLEVWARTQPLSSGYFHQLGETTSFGKSRELTEVWAASLRAQKKSADEIHFDGYVNSSEAIYKGKEVTAYTFTNGELLNDQGDRLPLHSIHVTSSISLGLPAAEGNGSSITEMAIYKQEWKGTDGVSWAGLYAPSPGNAAALTLYVNANQTGKEGEGYFKVNTGDNNFYVGATDNNVSRIGFDNPYASKLQLSFSTIETSAQIKTTNTLVVSDGTFQIEDVRNTLAYFGSFRDQKTGITIENLSYGAEAGAGITFKQNNTDSWLGALSFDKEDGTAGAFALYTDNPVGFIFQNLYYGSKSIPVRLSGASIAIGTLVEEPSSILTMEAHNKGFIPPRLTTEEMFNMENTTEGTTIYNKNLKTLCVFGGDEWRTAKGKRIKRPKQKKQNLRLTQL